MEQIFEINLLNNMVSHQKVVWIRKLETIADAHHMQ